MTRRPQILTIESLEKFERVINRDFRPYDINMMVMPGTLEDKHKNCASIPALRRQFNLIYLLLGGEHDVRLGAEHTRLRDHDLVIVPENTVYASDHIRHCTGFCIHFKTEFLQTLLQRPLSEEFPYFRMDAHHILGLSPSESKIIRQSFENIISEYQRFSPEKEYILRNLILILLLRVREIYRTHTKTIRQNTSRPEQLSTRFKQLVEKHFRTERTVSEYAARLGVTSGHLSDVVKKTTGRSPREVIQDMLFLESKVLLAATDKTLSEISGELNFRDLAHFSHFIKKKTGHFPQAFRKQLSV